MHFNGTGCPCASGVGKLPATRAFGTLPATRAFGVVPIARIPARAAIVTAVKPTAAPAVTSKPAPAAAPTAAAPSAPAAPPVHVVTASTAAATQTAASSVAAGAAPSASQAVAIIKQLVPASSTFRSSIPAPTISGGKAVSNLSGFARVAHAYRSQLSGFGQLQIRSAAAGAASGAALGTVVPGVGNVIGAAVGAIAGLISGLFGHKAAVPMVSQADVTQAQTWLQQYEAVAGHVIGRSLTASSFQDAITAMAILNPQFWGRSTPTALDIPAVNNFWPEVQTRLGDFFAALAAVPVGGTVTLHDDPSIPGHGKTNMNVSYSFTSPGVGAPSAQLAAYFAQYFYTMCTIFQPPSNCSGYLTAPFPQLLADTLDWWRSMHSQYDTAQPVVVSETPTLAAPSVTTSGGAVTSAATLPGTPGTPGYGVPGSCMLAPTVPAATGATVSATGAFSATGAPTGAQAAGFGTIGLILLALVGIPFIIGMKPKQK